MFLPFLFYVSVSDESLTQNLRDVCLSKSFQVIYSPTTGYQQIVTYFSIVLIVICSNKSFYGE
jgi:hypothetical protein